MSSETEQALDKITRNDRYIRRMFAAGAVVLTALVLFFGVWDRVDAAHTRNNIINTLQIVKDATDPNSKLSAQGRAEQAQVVNNLILCLENHENRLAARLSKTAAPAKMKGCP